MVNMKIRELIELLGSKADWDAEVEIDGVRTGLNNIELKIYRDGFDKKQYVNIFAEGISVPASTEEYYYVIHDYTEYELVQSQKDNKPLKIKLLHQAQAFVSNTCGIGEELIFEAVNDVVD